MPGMSEKMIRKLTEGREYRRIDVSGIQLREDGQGRMIVEGYATTFNQFYELYRSSWYILNEQVDAHAFDGCDVSDVIFQYNHEGRVMARTRNNTLELEADSHGLKIRADLGGTALGRQLYEEIKGGYTDRMSFGFRVKSDKREEIEDHESGTITINRTILAFEKLFDVSAVSIPANDFTEISARGYADGVIEELKALEERRAKERQKREQMLGEIRDLLVKKNKPKTEN